MKKVFTQLTVAAALLFMAACNTAPTDSKTAETKDTKTSFDPAAAKSSIEAENVKFLEAFKKGDSVAIASYYTDDAWVMPPNSEPVKGADIAALWGSFIRMGVKDFKLITNDVSGDETQLAETGYYELYGADNKLMDKGKYVVVWKAVNGGWKLYRDIFNTSMPAAPAK